MTCRSGVLVEAEALSRCRHHAGPTHQLGARQPACSSPSPSPCTGARVPRGEAVMLVVEVAAGSEAGQAIKPRCCTVRRKSGHAKCLTYDSRIRVVAHLSVEVHPGLRLAAWPKAVTFTG